MDAHVKVRVATIEDIDILTEQHVLMFKEICLEDMDANEISWDRMENAYHKKIREQIPARQCMAYLIVSQNIVYAGGAVSFIEGIPSPYDPGQVIGYVHSIYTYPEYRKKGYATIIMNKIIDTCKQRNVKRISLTASDLGVGIYKKLGFNENGGLSLIVSTNDSAETMQKIEW